ncbi:unnamed protein product [Somion occarium]|uniref:Uncharacterized protein n=1 Tax=Somion occarium TaxID=3059160 RepID=A0ABP1D7N3_9APHY
MLVPRDFSGDRVGRTESFQPENNDYSMKPQETLSSTTNNSNRPGVLIFPPSAILRGAEHPPGVFRDSRRFAVYGLAVTPSWLSRYEEKKKADGENTENLNVFKFVNSKVGLEHRCYKAHEVDTGKVSCIEEFDRHLSQDESFVFDPFVFISGTNDTEETHPCSSNESRRR